MNPSPEPRAGNLSKPSIPSVWRIRALLSIAATLLVLHLTNPHVGDLYAKYETANYVKSVDHPLESPIDTHYGYRLLPPVIVRLLPVPHPLGFEIIDYISLFGAAYLVFLILVHEQIRYDLALLCALLFLSFPSSTKWLLRYSACPDAFYLLVIAAIYYCIQRRRWRWFSFLLVVGTFTKLTIWVLWPVALLYGTERFKGKSWFRQIDWLHRIEDLYPSLLAFYLVRRI